MRALMLAFAALVFISSNAAAVPITYLFRGHIDGIHPTQPLPIPDWMPKAGTSYSGKMTFDSDAIMINGDDATCIVGDACGGLIAFQMSFGENVIQLEPWPISIQTWPGSENSFTAWNQTIMVKASGGIPLGGFDNFTFGGGGFSGMHAMDWIGVSGTGEIVGYYVPEPASIALLGLGLAGIAATRRRNRRA